MAKGILFSWQLLPWMAALTLAHPGPAGAFVVATDPPLDRNTAASLEGASWIWFAGDPGDPAKDAPIGTRFFRREFALRAGTHIKQARIIITADNAFTLYLNGKEIGRGEDWMYPKTFDLRGHLKPCRNILAVQAANEPAITATDPAGLIARLVILPAKGSPIVLVTDAAWRSAEKAQRGWLTPGFDARAWPHARVLGPYGRPPWRLARRHRPQSKQLRISPPQAPVRSTAPA